MSFVLYLLRLGRGCQAWLSPVLAVELFMSRHYSLYVCQKGVTRVVVACLHIFCMYDTRLGDRKRVFLMFLCCRQTIYCTSVKPKSRSTIFLPEKGVYFNAFEL